SGLLREIKANTRIPLITKAADHRKLLSDSAQRKFEQDLFASNLYETVRTQKNGTVFVNDIQKPPVIL
ncbi:MAG: nucleotidyltransferase, partial [Blautia coccoides]